MPRALAYTLAALALACSDGEATTGLDAGGRDASRADGAVVGDAFTPDGGSPGADGATLPDSGPVETGVEVFPGADWDEATPASRGMNGAALDAALDHFASIAGSQGIEQALVVRHGYLVWDGGDIDNRHNVWSTTKSFTSTVLGLLIDDGSCALDTVAAEHVASLTDEYPDVTLRHFATMTSGYDGGGDQSSTPFDPTEPLFAPGEQFQYWDSAMNQFANVLTRIAGEPIAEVFERRIGEPIGMAPADWEWRDFGDVDGLLVNGGAGNMSRGIHITARQLARFGLLLLARGTWDGTELLSSAWVDAASSEQVPATIPPRDGSAYTGAYGYNFWVNGTLASGERHWPDAPPRTFMAAGFNGNYCVVVPEWSLVFVRLGTDGTRLSAADWSEFFGLLGDAVK